MLADNGLEDDGLQSLAARREELLQRGDVLSGSVSVPLAVAVGRRRVGGDAEGGERAGPALTRRKSE